MFGDATERIKYCFRRMRNRFSGYNECVFTLLEDYDAINVYIDGEKPTPSGMFETNHFQLSRKYVDSLSYDALFDAVGKMVDRTMKQLYEVTLWEVEPA